jgi:hypothetical protein
VTQQFGTGVESPVGSRGWYLYGITTGGPVADILDAMDDTHPFADLAPASGESMPVQPLEVSGLCAVVAPVLLSDFDQPVLQARLRGASELETVVRAHHRVVEAIHARQAILPAKFGTVYGRAEDLLDALGAASGTLLPRLQRLEECDEWAVHVYADTDRARTRAAEEDEGVRRLRAGLATAGPGRAFFLERQIDRALDDATRRMLTAIAQRAFDALAGCAVASAVTPIGTSDERSEREILRAAFLVRRDAVERFMDRVRVETVDGVRSETTGPWPAYSFASWSPEELA